MVAYISASELHGAGDCKKLSASCAAECPTTALAVTVKQQQQQQLMTYANIASLSATARTSHCNGTECR